MDGMLFKAIFLAVFCSFFSFLLHLVIMQFKKTRQSDEPPVFELMRQAKLLSTLWLATFALMTFLFFLPFRLADDLFNIVRSLIGKINFLCGIAVYLFLCFIYLSLYYLVDRSVSATILEIIDASEQKKLTCDQINKIYDVEQKYWNELNEMEQGGFLIKKSDGYRLSLKGLLYAKAAKTIKGILRLGPGG